jgi:polynucleotide 5'-kinase involved in rRNA processing
MKKIAKPVLYKDFLEHITKEQKELDESMKEAFRQRDERKKTESEQLQEELEPINE